MSAIAAVRQHFDEPKKPTPRNVKRAAQTLALRAEMAIRRGHNVELSRYTKSLLRMGE